MSDELKGTITAEEVITGGLAIAKGDKGDKGDNGDKGDAYIITEADKQEIKESLSGDISELKGDLVNVIGTNEKEIAEIIDLSSADKIQGYYSKGNLSDGKGIGTSEMFTTYIIGLSKGDKVLITGKNYTNCIVYFVVNATKTKSIYVPSYRANEIIEDEEYVAKEDCYIYLGVYNQYYNKFHLKNVVKYIPMYASVELLDSTMRNSNYLYGKKWWAVGDSITFGARSDIDENGRRKTYATYIADRNRMDLKLDALSGRSMGVKEGRTDSFCLDGYYNNCPFDYPDYITIFLGTNDTEEVGTIDSTDISNFAGAYNKVLDYLTLTYPTAKIGIIPVYNMSGKLGKITVQIGEKWGVPVFDWDSHSFFYYRYQKNTVMERKQAAFMYFNGENYEVHPIDAGYQFMSTMIESWMREL